MSARRSPRIAAAAAWLAQEGAQALLALDPAFNSFIESHAVFALSGIRPEHASAVVVLRSGASALLTSHDEHGNDDLQAETDAVVRSEDLAAGIADYLKANGIGVEDVRVDGIDRIARGMKLRIEAALGGPLPTADGTVARLARIKSDDETRRIGQAAAIAEGAYAHLLEVARPGMREYELAAAVRGHAAERGAGDNFLLLSASRHNQAVRPPADRVLAEGDIILAEISPSVGAAFAQICRTVCIGEPPAQLLARYALLQEAMRAGLAAAGPGNAVSDVVAAMDGVFEREGLASYCRPPFMRVRGHGLGLASCEPGDLTRDNGTVLEEGMCFVMHPNQYLPDVGYLLFGDTVRIGEAGAEVLARGETPLGVAGLG